MFKQLLAVDHCLGSNLVLVCVKVMTMIFIENVINGIASLKGDIHCFT